MTYDVSSLHGKRKEIISFLMDASITFDIISQIELAVYEALVNIIEHNPHPSPGARITTDCRVRASAVEVTITNDGSRFDPTTAPLPDLKEHFMKGKRRGLGIYIIRTLMDSVTYSYRKGINTLRMEKSLAQDA